MFRINQLYTLVLSLLLISCDTDTEDLSVPAWDLDVKGPLAFSSINVNQLGDFDENNVSTNIVGEDFGLNSDDEYSEIPPVGPVDLPPIPLDFSDYIVSADFNKAVVRMKLVNTFPMNMLAGTEFVFVDSLGNEVLSIATSKDLDGFNGELTEVIIIDNVEIPLDVDLVIRNFRTSGYDPPGDETIKLEDREISVEFSFTEIDIASMLVQPQQTQIIEEVTDIDFSNENNETGVDEGVFNIFIENELPIDFNFNIYFLDQNDQILDSLFNSLTNVKPAINQINTEIKKSVTFDSERYQRIQQSEKISFVIYASTLNTSLPYRIFSEDKFNLQLTGDFNYNFEP